MTPTQQSAPASHAQGRPGNPVNYAVTRDDLLILARHHVLTILDILVEHFYTGAASGSSGRAMRAAKSDLVRLEEVLGEETITAIRTEVEAPVRRRMGRARWHLFQNGGTQADHERVTNETNECMVYVDNKMDDPEARDLALAHLRVEPSGVFLDADGGLWSLAEPHDDGDPRLVLALTTLRGGIGYDAKMRVERPAEWFAPYGLGQR